MTDEGAAGGGCEYCHGRSVTALYLDKAEGCYAFVDGPKLNICSHGAGMTVPICVCPMCAPAGEEAGGGLEQKGRRVPWARLASRSAGAFAGGCARSRARHAA